MRDTTEYQVSGAGCFSEIDAKAPSVESDALKEHEWCGSSSEGAKCGVSDLSVVSEANEFRFADKVQDALNNLVSSYVVTKKLLNGLRAENKSLREQVAELMDESRELAELKKKLREMVR